MLYRHEPAALVCLDGVTEQNLEGSSALTGAPQTPRESTAALVTLSLPNLLLNLGALKELVLLYCYLWPFVLSLQCFCLYCHEHLHGQTVNQIRELIQVETNLVWGKKIKQVRIPF